MNIKRYIESGVIEAYAMGLATPMEKEEFERLLPEYPELRHALFETETRIETFASQQSITPPPRAWKKIEAFLEDLPATTYKNSNSSSNHQEYITVPEVTETHIRVHKYWRLALLIIFILSKIFLLLFVYYFLQYQKTTKKVEQLQQQLQMQRAGH